MPRGGRYWSADHTAGATGGFLLTSGQVITELRAQGEHGSSMASLALVDELVGDVVETLPHGKAPSPPAGEPFVQQITVRRQPMPGRRRALRRRSQHPRAPPFASSSSPASTGCRWRRSPTDPRALRRRDRPAGRNESAAPRRQRPRRLRPQGLGGGAPVNALAPHVRRRPRAALLAVLLLAGCTGISASNTAAPELPSLRAAGYRIAVLPFTVTAPEDGFLGDSLAPVGELLALEARRELPMRDRLGALVHDDAVAWLRHSDFQVLEPWHVLTHARPHRPAAERTLDAAQLRPSPARSAPTACCTAKCAAGTATTTCCSRWSRSRCTSNCSTRRPAARCSRAIGRDDRLGPDRRPDRLRVGGDRTDRRPARLDLRSLTRSVTRHAVTDLNGGELGAEPGATSPRLALVALAKDHDGPFRVGERVDVIAVGSPDCQVCFDLGALRTVVPMRETQPRRRTAGARATYLGHYIVQASDRAEELPVTCTIQRGKARRTVAVRYRWAGSVALAGAATTSP
jgi:hypothetical protein